MLGVEKKRPAEWTLARRYALIPPFWTPLGEVSQILGRD
jgi:hypothetical protein